MYVNEVEHEMVNRKQTWNNPVVHELNTKDEGLSNDWHFAAGVYITTSYFSGNVAAPRDRNTDVLLY